MKISDKKSSFQVVVIKIVNVSEYRWSENVCSSNDKKTIVVLEASVTYWHILSPALFSLFFILFQLLIGIAVQWI